MSTLILYFYTSPVQATPAKVARLRRTIINKQTLGSRAGHSRKWFWGHLYQFLGWWQDNAEPAAKSGRSLLPLTERSRWPGQPGQRGVGDGVRGRRGKGTFAVQLAALCEAGTVGRYRAGERRVRSMRSLALLQFLPLSVISPSLTLPDSVFHTNHQSGNPNCVRLLVM